MDIVKLPLVKDMLTPVGQALIRGLLEADARDGPEIRKVSKVCREAAEEHGFSTVETVRDAVVEHLRDHYPFYWPVAAWSGASCSGNLVEVPVFLDPEDGGDSVLFLLKIEFVGDTYLPVVTLRGPNG